jgi:hypothetical protein
MRIDARVDLEVLTRQRRLDDVALLPPAMLALSAALKSNRSLRALS